MAYLRMGETTDSALESEQQLDLRPSTVSWQGALAAGLYFAVSLLSPFALLTNTVPPPQPILPGWESWVLIYITRAHFSVAWYQDRYVIGGATQADALIFAVLALLMAILLLFRVSQKISPRPTLVLMTAVALSWLLLCQSIYGTIADWTLMQIPVSPLLGLAIAALSIRM